MDKNLELIKSEINNLNILSKMNNIDEIIKRSSILIKKFPKIQIFYNFLGSSLEKKNQIYDAEIVYIKSLKVDPNNIFALINLGRISRIINNLQRSEELFKQVLDLEPENLLAQLNYGELKIDQNKFKEAILIFEKIYEKNKDFQNIIMRLANTYSMIGEFKKAEEYLSIVSKKNPELFAADYRLSNIINYSERKDHQQLILEKIQNTKFDNINKHPLYFAIAKSYEDQKDYEQAFKYMELGNKERNKLVIGNPLRYEEFFLNKNKEIFSNIDIKENANNDFYNKKLIFIVGLPRSGTTLLHQILSAHSETYGVGESIILNVFFFKNLVNDNFLKNLKKDNKINTENSREISLKLGKNYDYFDLNKIKIDKAPSNFFWIGFISTLFPNSKIIHIKRNIKDNCLSIYKNVFGGNRTDWTYDITNIKKYVKIYKEMMNFWKNKIDKKIYEINYEDLVKNQEIEIRNLLNFCNLQFEQGCLNYHKSKNPIKTVSINQSRKPIYKDSIDSNLKYKNFNNFFKDI
jgi:tetratricopeptide (TPR) repeat protein|tara:strand:- start:82 stop:1641 length:1560 start_codon:yes stop_codon:yes gene_type:complete